MTTSFSLELSTEESALLSENESFYDALDSGERTPSTEAQKHFVAVCRGESAPETHHEVLWLKVRMIKESAAVARAESDHQVSATPIDSKVADAMEHEIREKADFAESNRARAFISSTF